MKITQSKLRAIISEEIKKALIDNIEEGSFDSGPLKVTPDGVDPAMGEWIKDELNLIWNKLKEIQDRMGRM